MHHRILCQVLIHDSLATKEVMTQLLKIQYTVDFILDEINLDTV